MKNKEHLYNSQEVLKNLDSSKDGLSNAEAKKRLERYGANVLPKPKKDNIFKLILHKLLEPIVLVLLVTIIISLLANEVVDALAIVFIVIVDLIMGIYQEKKAQKSAEALASMLKIKAKVIRDGKEIEIDASDLVPGDIIYLESGTKVSADARIIDCTNLLVDESALTGESNGVEKFNGKLEKDVQIAERKNIVFTGTSVLTGRGTAVVIETGVNTQIGQIANTVSETKETKSPLSIRMNKFTKQISILVVLIAIFLTIMLYLKGSSGKDIFLTVVALAVSAMPEGLSLALTMALTIASTRMMKKFVIVKNLNAVESLGSCTVIATDKTGTLTKNQQTAKVFKLPDASLITIDGTGYNDVGKINVTNKNYEKQIKWLAKIGSINNEALIEDVDGKWEYLGDSIDIALKFLAKKAEVNINDIEIIDSIPYESQNKYSAVFFKYAGKYYCTTKGAPDIITDFCKTMTKNNRKVKINVAKLEKENDDLAKDGYRLIAFATKEVSKKKKYSQKDLVDLNFEGMIGFIDPVREESVESIKLCKKAGIDVLMITGDHPLTALKIAKDLKLASKESEITTGEELEVAYANGPEAFQKFIKNKKVFARVTPLDKFHIVEALKDRGEFVAVTGDGVNDAPAIKAANIGVAMGSGTDVAKETSSMILMNDNFTSIVEGIKEGRGAYSNIRKICSFLLSCGLCEVLFFMMAIFFNLPMPLVAIQLLWLNVVTDGLQDMALSFEKVKDKVMDEKPRSPKESLFNKPMLKEVFFAATYMSIVIFILWAILLKVVGMEVASARGYVMALMVFFQNMHALNCRSGEESVFKYRNKNTFMLISIVSAIVLQIIIMEVPLLSSFLQATSIPIVDLIVLFAISLTILLAMEIYKVFNYGGKNEKRS